jgi:hypothetical protein
MVRAIDSNLDKRDWTFNNGPKEWYNSKMNLTLRHCVIEKLQANGNISTTIANPL